MNDRRSSHHHHHHQRQTFEEKYRTLENELKKKNQTIELLRNEYNDTSQVQPHDLSRSSFEQSFVRNGSQRSSTNSNWHTLTKDREIAKLKALVFQKDNELIAMTTSHKNALLQMEERMERERKVWTEHKDLLLAGERAKFDEEKNLLLKDLQQQLTIEHERCQRLEQKLYDAQMQSSEAKLMLKESGRERINAVYGTKEQCRKEFQDEITRLRQQFQLEKDGEFTRIQERIRELEATLDQVSTENADSAVRQHELFVNLENSEKNCVRAINDSIKKLLMAMDSPSHIYATIPHVSSFTYDRESIIERIPTRSVLKLLQDTVDDIRNYILEQRVQIEAKLKIMKKSKSSDYSNRTYDDQRSVPPPPPPPSRPSTHSKHRKQQESSRYENSFQLSSQQNDTIDNLVQKLEDHIATELDRLTKQRITLNSSNHHHDDRSTSYHVEPPKKVKFESIPSSKTSDEANQDSLIRHLQSRISDLRDDNKRLRDHQQSRSITSSYQENDHTNSFSSIRSRNYPANS